MILHAVVFVGAQIVMGFLGYWQGRKDEERRWLRYALKNDGRLQ